MVKGGEGSLIFGHALTANICSSFETISMQTEKVQCHWRLCRIRNTVTLFPSACTTTGIRTSKTSLAFLVIFTIVSQGRLDGGVCKNDAAAFACTYDKETGQDGICSEELGHH